MQQYISLIHPAAIFFVNLYKTNWIRLNLERIRCNSNARCVQWYMHAAASALLSNCSSVLYFYDVHNTLKNSNPDIPNVCRTLQRTLTFLLYYSKLSTMYLLVNSCSSPNENATLHCEKIVTTPFQDNLPACSKYFLHWHGHCWKRVWKPNVIYCSKWFGKMENCLIWEELVLFSFNIPFHSHLFLVFSVEQIYYFVDLMKYYLY